MYASVALLVAAREHAAEVLAACEEDELVCVHGVALDQEGDVAELLVVHLVGCSGAGWGAG